MTTYRTYNMDTVIISHLPNAFLYLIESKHLSK